MADATCPVGWMDWSAPALPALGRLSAPRTQGRAEAGDGSKPTHLLEEYIHHLERRGMAPEKVQEHSRVLRGSLGSLARSKAEIEVWRASLNRKPDRRGLTRVAILGAFDDWLCMGGHCDPDPSRPSSSPRLSEFFEHCIRRGLRPRTAEAYRQVLMAVSRNLDLVTATGADLEQWLASKDVSAVSRNNYLSALRTYYRWALRNELVKVDPTAWVDKARTPRNLPRPIATEDLAKALLAADCRMRVILSLAAYGGLRAGEIARLRGVDVDVHMKTIRADGKGGHQRVVPLPAEAETALVAYGLHPGRLILNDKTGEPASPARVSQMVRQHFMVLGMPWRCHSCRHWYGTEVYRQTRDLRLTQSLLGHSSVATTELYTKLTPSERSNQIVRQLSVASSSPCDLDS